MKILSDKEINEFLEEAKKAIESFVKKLSREDVKIEDYQWIIDEIININNVSEKDALNDIKYMSYSSNYFDAVAPLMNALEMRISNEN